MKVYVDFKDLDAEDMPSNISNKYDLQVRSINGGSEYRNIEVLSLADYTKQVRKEVVQEIREKAYKDSELYDAPNGKISERKTYLISEHILDQIQD